MSEIALRPADVDAAAAHISSQLPGLHAALAAAQTAQLRATAEGPGRVATALTTTGSELATAIEGLETSLARLAQGLATATGELVDQDLAMGGARHRAADDGR